MSGKFSQKQHRGFAGDNHDRKEPNEGWRGLVEATSREGGITESMLPGNDEMQTLAE
jgi:hypothetical protein